MVEAYIFVGLFVVSIVALRVVKRKWSREEREVVRKMVEKIKKGTIKELAKAESCGIN